MKKIFMFAAAMLALFSCKEEKMDNPGVTPSDNIELSSEEKVMGPEAGKVQVMVTSSGEWTVAPSDEYDWVSVDKTSGVDGDVVTFDVSENTTDNARVAEFTFTSGEASAEFTITSNPSDMPEIELKSESEMTFSYDTHENQEIRVYAEGMNYQDFAVTVSESADSWLHYLAVLPGDTDSDGKVMFSVDALEGLADREATVTISMAGTQAPVEVKVLQEAERVILVDPYFTAAMEGETIEVPVSSNVEYKIEITSENGTDWITYKENKDGKEYFEVKALSDGKRSALVTLTQTDVEAGKEPVSAQFSVTQQKVFITWAARMNGNRLFPKWEGGGPGTVFRFTWEMLFYADSFDKNQGEIFTLMGIEGRFLLRFGDKGNALDHIQVATSSGTYNVPVSIEPKKWHHLAVTFDSGPVKVYIDGEKVGEYEFYQSSVNLSPMWSYEPTGNRCMWMGYSYNANRDFWGMMTEIRIWTRVLSEEEINAPNHFYEVDPESEGLYSYWKFTSGEGNTIEDATGKGNPLHGEVEVEEHRTSNGSLNMGSEGIEFVPVSLPER